MSENINNKKEEKIQKSNVKKFLLIFFIILFLAIVLVTSTIIIKEKMYKYDLEEVTEFSYFTLYQNQKYGVIDKQGNIIVEAKYDRVAIPNPSKPVFICYYDYDEQKETYKTKVYNDRKEEIFSQYEQVLPLMFQDSTAKVPYEKSVLKYKENDKYGIIDFYGNKITKAEYSSIESLLYKEGYLIVGKDNKYGIINGKGKEVVEINYDTITADGYYNENSKYKFAGFIIGNKTENGYQYGYINYKGEILLNTEYNEVDRVTEIVDDKNVYLVAFKNGQAGILKNKKYILQHQYEDIEYNKKNQLFLVQKLSKQGIIDLEGKQIINTEYDYIFISGNKIIAQKNDENYIFDTMGNKEESKIQEELISTDNDNYFITIGENEKYGVLNKNGEILINNEYQYIEYAFDDYFIATKNGKIGVLNYLNEIKIEFKYDVIQKIENTNILQAITTKDNTIELYNKNLEKVTSMKNAIVYNKDNYIEIVSDNNLIYLNNDGSIISNKEILSQNTLLSYKKDDKWGFVDISGEIKIDAIYDMVTEFNSYGFAGIKKDNKWGVININGEVIIEPSYIINWQNPEFIGKYCRVNFGYGLDYYTDDL